MPTRTSLQNLDQCDKIVQWSRKSTYELYREAKSEIYDKMWKKNK